MWNGKGESFELSYYKTKIVDEFFEGEYKNGKRFGKIRKEIAVVY